MRGGTILFNIQKCFVKWVHNNFTQLTTGKWCWMAGDYLCVHFCLDWNEIKCYFHLHLCSHRAAWSLLEILLKVFPWSFNVREKLWFRSKQKDIKETLWENKNDLTNNFKILKYFQARARCLGCAHHRNMSGNSQFSPWNNNKKRRRCIFLRDRWFGTSWFVRVQFDNSVN